MVKRQNKTNFIIGFICSILPTAAYAGLPQCGATSLSPIELVNIYKNRAEYPNFTLICAHRGIWIHRGRPQNSRAAFQAAIDAGVDCVENDIKWTSDGVPVLFHDPHMDMMVVDANGNPVTGSIESYSWDQLKTYRLRDRLLNITIEKILPLSDFISMSRGHIVQNHEIKMRKSQVGPQVYKSKFISLITMLNTADALKESIIKGELTSAEYADVLTEVEQKGVSRGDVVYVPKFFSESPNVNSEITAFNNLGVTSYELVVENNTSPLIPYFTRLDTEHKRYGAFDLIPESGRGRYTSSNAWREINPATDFRGDWEWIFQGGYSFLITDRPCMASAFLDKLGKRER